MPKVRSILACSACRQQVSQWVGRCPGCGQWGTIDEVRAAGGSASRSGGAHALSTLSSAPDDERRVSTGSAGIDRVLGGGVVPASVALLAGEPGIGKSTLLLHVLAHLSTTGQTCVLVSGEESHAQVAARARRLGVSGDAISFAPGRDLAHVLETARDARPFLLAVDSIQTLRDTSGTQMPGGPSQVRMCTDALVGLAKEEGIAVLLTGHVTKDGDLAGPRTLEHAVDVVLTFDGDPRSGLRVLSGGKNRFGAEGETAWFEMGAQGLTEIDPTELLVSHSSAPGAAIALPQAGRRALAVEVQALVGAADGPARRQATGLDPRRFQLVAAVLDRGRGHPARPIRAVRGVLGRGPPGRSGVRSGHRRGARLRGLGRRPTGGVGVRGRGGAHGSRQVGPLHGATRRGGPGGRMLRDLRRTGRIGRRRRAPFHPGSTRPRGA